MSDQSPSPLRSISHPAFAPPWEALLALFAADRDAFYLLAAAKAQPDLEVERLGAFARRLRQAVRGTYNLVEPFRGEGYVEAAHDRLPIPADSFRGVQAFLQELVKRKDAPDRSDAEERFWDSDPWYVTGLDLGRDQDHSALVTVEVVDIPNPARPGTLLPRFDMRHIHRWPLGTPYPAVVADVKAQFARPPLKGTPLVIDETGVGKGVVDQFRQANLGAILKPYSITAGREPGKRTVPKKDLVATLQTALGTRRLRIAEELPLAAVLMKELEMFRVKVTADRNETFGAWRERDHDDLVLAAAFACWYATRHSGGLVISTRDMPAPPKMVSKPAWIP